MPEKDPKISLSSLSSSSSSYIYVHAAKPMTVAESSAIYHKEHVMLDDSARSLNSFFLFLFRGYFVRR
jgi:hypothetical protein